MTTLFKFRLDHAAAGHIHVTLFVGEQGKTLANAGRLVLDPGQWQLLGTALSLGAPVLNRFWPFVAVEVENERATLDAIAELEKAWNRLTPKLQRLPRARREIREGELVTEADLLRPWKEFLR
jgi:hypothetical protein